MKIKKTILLLLLTIAGVALVFGVVKSIPTKQEIRAKQIIQTYMNSKGMDIKPGTEEYKIFMRGIVWGEYPELTGSESDFINNQNELDCVLDYAWKHSGYKGRYGGYDELEMEEAAPPTESDK